MPASVASPRVCKRRLELDGDDVDEIPKTRKMVAKAEEPVTPTKKRVVVQAETPPSTPKTVYSIAKALFQKSSRGVVGRDEERQFLTEWFENENGALYISGLPGTGKSALVNEVLSTIKGKRAKAVVNCMSVSRPDFIYDHIYSALTGRDNAPNAYSKLEKLFFGKKLHVVVLDELDHILTTKDQTTVLFNLFKWAADPQSSLLLVGIANALDLTERFLPRLRANDISPTHYTVKAYTAPQIAAIIEAKLRSLSGGNEEDAIIPLMHPAAIQLCARKTAASTGDVRKAFDICRRAIDLVEEQERRKLDDSKRGYSSHVLTSLTIEQAPKATVMHVSKVCASAFGGSAASRIKSLNLYQKALLCVVATQPAKKGITLSELFEKYNQLASAKEVIGTLQYGEFLQLITALESNGVVTLMSPVARTKGINAGQKRITSSVQKMDLMCADVDLIRNFIHDE